MNDKYSIARELQYLRRRGLGKEAYPLERDAERTWPGFKEFYQHWLASQIRRCSS